MSPAAGRGRAGRGRLGLVGSHLRPEAPAPQREADGGTGAQRGVSSAAGGRAGGVSWPQKSAAPLPQWGLASLLHFGAGGSGVKG